jgi:N-acetylglucosamine-6-phosphate deacetylase
MNTLLLRDVRAVLPERILDKASVLISGQKILEVSPDTLQADTVIELSEAVLLPGFIDVHNHGSVGVDVMDASEEALGEVSRYLASRGITSWLPTLVPASNENYARVAEAIESAMKGNLSGARVLGLHYEGPFVNTAQCGALHRHHFKAYRDPSDLESLRVPERGIKMITLAPEVDGGIALVKELNECGWIVSIGHTRAEVNLLDDAFANGARHMTHFMNAMLPLHHRNPGPIGWGLSRDDVTCDIIADGIHLDPSILRLLLKIKGPGRLSLISDAIAATGKGDGSYQIWGETITVTNRCTCNASGSIAGSVITMLDAVRMMRSLGVPDIDVARMASSNPARLLKIDHECGSIEEGKRADLVAIDGEGRVKLTLVGGNIVFRE